MGEGTGRVESDDREEGKEGVPKGLTLERWVGGEE